MWRVKKKKKKSITLWIDKISSFFKVQFYAIHLILKYIKWVKLVSASLTQFFLIYVNKYK